MTELKKRVLKDSVANIPRSGKHYKLSFWEKYHPGTNLRERSKPKEPKGNKKEEDRALMQLKKTQAYLFVGGLLMAS